MKRYFNLQLQAILLCALFVRRKRLLYDSKRLLHFILVHFLSFIKYFKLLPRFKSSKVEKIKSDILHFSEPSLEHRAIEKIFEFDFLPKNDWIVRRILDNVPSFRTVHDWHYRIVNSTVANVSYTTIISDEVLTDNSIVFFIHGGGYISGSAEGYEGVLTKLSKHTRLPVVAPDYSLCPSVKTINGITPKDQVQELYLVYNFFCKQGKKIIIVGDSAGGGLTIGLTQHLISKRGVKPDALVLISPMADLTYSGDSHWKNIPYDHMIQEYATDIVFKSVIEQNGADPRHPEFSFIFGSFNKFPKCFVIASETERLYSDSVAIVKKLRKENCEVMFESAKFGIHVYPFFSEFAPEYKESFLRIAQYIRIVADIDK